MLGAANGHKLFRIASRAAYFSLLWRRSLLYIVQIGGPLWKERDVIAGSGGGQIYNVTPTNSGDSGRSP